jgi:hypothetical protein
VAAKACPPRQLRTAIETSSASDSGCGGPKDAAPILGCRKGNRKIRAMLFGGRARKSNRKLLQMGAVARNCHAFGAKCCDSATISAPRFQPPHATVATSKNGAAN